jgi:thiol-disulfide isomerase/thioredoxin
MKINSKHKNYVIMAVIFLIILTIIFIETSKPSRIINDRKITSEGQYSLAPEFSNIDSWINSQPLKIEDLRGKVVLIDFWTYSCINCIRTFPYINSWYDKYSDDGLVIIGVHTPEFKFETEYDNVLMATKKYNIKFPVALDNKYSTWNSYNNNYWPRKYLIDKEGYIRYDHIGEGAYEETEKMIQKLLLETGSIVNEELSNIEEQTPTTQNTRELYLGYDTAIPRGQNIGNIGGLIPEIEKQYIINSDIYPNIVYLNGSWISKNDAVVTRGDNELLYLQFKAKKAHIVLDGPIGTRLNVTVDDYIPNTSDVDNFGYLTIDSPRLYTVYDGEYGFHTLKIYISTSNVGINSFTFG